MLLELVKPSGRWSKLPAESSAACDVHENLGLFFPIFTSTWDLWRELGLHVPYVFLVDYV